MEYLESLNYTKKRISEPLKYISRVAFALLAVVGGYAINEFGYENKEALPYLVGLGSIVWGGCEATGNICLTIESIFEGGFRIKNGE